MSSFLSSRGNERSLTQDILTELRCIAKTDLPMVEMTDTLFCHPREGGDLPSIQPDLRLIASMRFAAFPVVKLQQSSEVYCHTESDTNLHGNDKPRIQTSYLLPLVEGQASAVQRVPIVGTSRGSEVRAGGVTSPKFPIHIHYNSALSVIAPIIIQESRRVY